MKLVIAIGCIVLFVGCQEASAAAALPAVDFSTMTCEQFWQRTPASDRGPFLFWLSGYFGHKKLSCAGPRELYREDQGSGGVLRQAAR